MFQHLRTKEIVKFRGKLSKEELANWKQIEEPRMQMVGDVSCWLKRSCLRYINVITCSICYYIDLALARKNFPQFRGMPFTRHLFDLDIQILGCKLDIVGLCWTPVKSANAVTVSLGRLMDRQDFKLLFEGICIELLRFDASKTKEMAKISRSAGTTLDRIRSTSLISHDLT